MNSKDGRRLARFDWWQASVFNADPDMVLEVLKLGADLSSIYPSTPHHGYLHGAEVKRGDISLGKVWWGGNPGVHVQASGESAPGVARIIQAAALEFPWSVHVTRADACLDWRMEGLFDEVSGKLIKWALKNNIKLDYEGDWARGEARSLYLGSRSSVCQLVLYEKGYEQQDDDKTWVRLEARIYPKKEARVLAGDFQPYQVFQVSWLPAVLEAVGFAEIEHYAIGTVWRKSDAERARAALMRQYRKVITAWADEVGGWDALGPAMAAKIEEQLIQKAKMKAACDGGRVTACDQV